MRNVFLFTTMYITCRSIFSNLSKHMSLTLVYLIIMQDGINVQDGKIPKTNKHAGWNKAVQVGIFQKLLLWKPIWGEKFQKLINVQDGIRVCRLDFFKKIISCAARLLDRPEYSLWYIVQLPPYYKGFLYD